ncbi:hypothetical protein ECG_07856 [Echinococcus granulosus]|nr:hypothetical protein ECG_07856 [Echinococcus granulosus]
MLSAIELYKLQKRSRDAEQESIYQDVVKAVKKTAEEMDVKPQLPAVTAKRKKRKRSRGKSAEQNEEEVEVKSEPEEGEHVSIPELVESEGEHAIDEPPILGDRAVNALALGETLMQILLGGGSFVNFLDNYYGLKPMHSSCGEVRRNFNCIFPVQMMDRLIAEEELFFEYDVEIIPSPREKSKPPKEGRAYRSIVWGQFGMGASIRILLPERFNTKLSAHLGFLQEVINGPLYSVVTFVNKQFVGPLFNPSSPSIYLPGDMFIIVMEGSLDIDVLSPKDGEMESQQHELKGVFVSGDVVYIPYQFSHRAKLSGGKIPHAIALCIVNRAPVLVEECGQHLLKALHLEGPKNKERSLFRELLISTHNNPKNASDILYFDLNAEEEVELVLRKWLKGEDGVCTKEEAEAINQEASEMRQLFIEQSVAVRLNFTEEAGHATFFGPIWDDPNFIDAEGDEDAEAQIERLPNPRAEGCVKFDREMESETIIRLTRRSAIILLRRRKDDDDGFCIHHSLCNSRDARVENGTTCLRMSRKLLPIVEWLIAIYPEDTMVCDLPGDNINDQMKAVNVLFDAGLILSPVAYEESAIDYEAEEGAGEEGRGTERGASRA